MNKYYVYGHFIKSTNVLFYIGKGCHKRAAVKHNRNALWNELVAQHDYYSLIIRDNLSEKEAINFEQELLNEFPTECNIMRKSSPVKAIDYDIVSKAVYYAEDSPTFLRWVNDRANGAIKAGAVAGSFDSAGYGQVYIKNKLYKIHRIVWVLTHQQNLDSTLIIDHKDRNKSNNHKDNLRLTTLEVNAKNVNWSVSKPSNTGLQGISHREIQRLYRVCWSENSKQFEKSFSYDKVKSHKDQPRFPDKQAALQAAITFRNSLVAKGIIVLVSDKHPNLSQESTQSPMIPEALVPVQPN